MIARDRQGKAERRLPDHVCADCRLAHASDRLQSVCESCGGPLLVQYRSSDPVPSLSEVMARRPGQFRFHERLPLSSGADTPTLGEGGTPLIKTPRLGPHVWIKDEAQNPTGSFKARGMAIAISRNIELGADRFCLPSNGNAGAAAAAYGALHDVAVEVVVPGNTPGTLLEEIEAFGAGLIVAAGSIADAARVSQERVTETGAFSLATLHEPFRVEGKKMMGYEIFWDMGALPEVIVYPTGGGTGLVGMVKAFDEMEELGWIGSERPRMVAVQVSGCAPIVRAFHAGEERAAPWVDPESTAAFGLRVPSALGDRLMLEALRGTHGTAVAVSEDQLPAGVEKMASQAGIWGSPEGGACMAAYDVLRQSGWIQPSDRVVLFNTGAAALYI